MNIIHILIIATVIILLVLFILLKSKKVPKQLYTNKSVYYGHKERLVRALFSEKYGLIGKPDFILHTKDGLLPLEIKHSKRPSQPYFSHVMQLISYCLLIEEEKGVRPKYGYLQYKGGRAFPIAYTERRKVVLIKIMDEMRGYISSGKGPNPILKCKCGKCT